MTTEQTYSINGAAALTGYSLPTVRKRLPELGKYGAVQIDGRWQIPLSALHAVGLMSRVTSNPVSKENAGALDSETISELDALRGQLAEALQRAAVAEAVAAERERALERADMALRMLESRAGPVEPLSASQSPQRASWLGRLRGSH
jgi:hypothetical protein